MIPDAIAKITRVNFEPPPGEIVNIVDPSNLKVPGIILGAIFYFLACVFVLCHAYTVFRILRKVSFEDVLLYIAWAFFSAFMGVAFWAAIIPLGIHIWNMTIWQLQQVQFRVNILLILFGCTITFLKAAITIKCLRVFVPKGNRNFMFWTSWMLVWGHTIFYIIYVMFFVFQCNPREAVWDLSITEKKCIDASALNIASGFVNTITDLILLILPHFIIWKLKMPVRKKKGLSFLFCLGVLVCAASVCRLVYIIKYSIVQDKSYYIAIQGLVAFIELSLGFLIACLPLMPKFFAVTMGISLLGPATPRSGETRRLRHLKPACGLPRPFGRGNRSAKPDEDSDEGLVDPNVIVVTQTYQVLFEDADPMTLKSR